MSQRATQTKGTCPVGLYEGYEELRKAGSVVWDPAREAWILLGYSEAQAALRDEVRFAHPDRRDLVPDEEAWADITEVLGGDRALILLRGDKHKSLHTLMSRAINALVRKWRAEVIVRIADRLMSRWHGCTAIDFVDEFADLFPSAVIAAILGLPWQEDESLLWECKRLNDAIGRAREGFSNTKESLAEGRRAGRQLQDLLYPVVHARGITPQDDLISDLWTMGREVFADWSEDDVVAQCRMLFFAGSASTSQFLANGAYLLFSDPELWAKLKEDTRRVPRFVEEALRVQAVVQSRPRVADVDMTFAGKSIHRGDRIIVTNAAANCDPEAFADPHRVHLEPKAKGAPAHIAFNVGPRVCPGAGLARAEGVEVFSMLLDRMQNVRFDADKPAPEYVGELMSSWRPLHIVFDPIERACQS
jgi:cytochrome P450